MNKFMALISPYSIMCFIYTILKSDKITSRNFALYAGFFSVIVGSTVTIGWITDTTVLKSIVPGYISMKANTAICFILIGFSFVFSQKCYKNEIHTARFLCLLEKVCLFGVACIAVCALLQEVLNADFGIDQLLFKDLIAPLNFLPHRFSTGGQD